MQKSSKKTRVHIYPPFGGTNAYIRNMVDSFERAENYELTRHRLKEKPLWNLYLNIDADICIFSWIEGMCTKKKGILKFAYVVFFIILLRLFGKKAVWVLHNKYPHEKDSALIREGMRILATLSSAVITHSGEGVAYFEQQYHKKKCYYIPHPVYSTELKKSYPSEWDYVVWGEINKRKGVKEFVDHVKEDKGFSDKSILICGRCKDKVLAEAITNEAPSNVTFINRFIPDEEMEEYIGRSRCIVFTYHSSSVLSSGALIYSLNFCKPIIGPNVGAFREMKGIVTTYESFADIPMLTAEISQDKVEDYISDNQWSDFPRKIAQILKHDDN